MRRIVGVLIAIALGIGVFALWPRSSDDPPANTEAAGTSTTTTVTTVSPSTTSTVGTTTTNAEASHVVETVEEAEVILRELWFGWFEGIYNQDEERIREVVGNPDQVEAATAQFGVMAFESQPTRDAIAIREIEILHSDSACLAVWANVDASQIVDASNDGVHVFIYSEDHWMFISQWAFREDLWEEDCDAQPLS